MVEVNTNEKQMFSLASNSNGSVPLLFLQYRWACCHTPYTLGVTRAVRDGVPGNTHDRETVRACAMLVHYLYVHVWV